MMRALRLQWLWAKSVAVLAALALAFAVVLLWPPSALAQDSATAPTIKGRPAITSSPASGDAYGEGDAIQVTVTFSGPVDVTGKPRLRLGIGSANRWAKYASGTGGDRLVFSYTVRSGDADVDGVSIRKNSLKLNGGTIAVGDGTAAKLKHKGLPDRSGHLVDGVQPTVTGLSITSTSAGGNAYRVADTVQVTVTFSEPVSVAGKPRVRLAVGDVIRWARYTGETAGNGLVFSYRVKSGDADADGISIRKNSLKLNGGTITDAARNPAKLNHAPVAGQSGHLVDGVAPTVTALSIASTPAGGAYRFGDAIQVTATFSEPVLVTGAPVLTLTIGDAARQSASATQSGDKTRVNFEYLVVVGDLDTDGVGIPENAMALPGAGDLIVDAAGNPADLDHAPVAGQDGHQVDGVAPVITDLSITSAPAGGAYIFGDAIQATATFSEPVSVTGAPVLTLTIGDAARQSASATQSVDKTRVNFEYLVIAGDLDTDGVSISKNAMALPGVGDLIVDAAGNPADLDHASVAGQSGQLVDGVAPTVTALSIVSAPDGGAYRVGDAIQATATFSEPVSVTGAPVLTLTVGDAARQSASATQSVDKTRVNFEYLVIAGDLDTDGVSIPANAMALPGAGDLIVDAAGNPADLDHAPVAGQDGHQVDGVAPVIADLSITSAPAGGAYIFGDAIQVTATFSEPVSVAGAPVLTLTIGDVARQSASATQSVDKTRVNFEYLVVAGDQDTDGVSISKNAMALPGDGDLIVDAAGNPADLSHSPVAGRNGQLVDGAVQQQAAGQGGQGGQQVAGQGGQMVDNVAPTVTGLSVTSTAAGDGTYRYGDAIQVTVTFNEQVTVTGYPSLTLGIGAAARQSYSVSQPADKTKVHFSYLVSLGDLDTDGISIPENAITTPVAGDLIKDAADNTANLDHAAVPALAGHLVDASPAVAATSRPRLGHIYHQGDFIYVTAIFGEAVKVTGKPRLRFTIGSNERSAAYLYTDGAKVLFNYRVTSSDMDPDGVSIPANAITLPGAGDRVQDREGNNLNLKHSAVSADLKHPVDGSQPRAERPSSDAPTGLTAQPGNGLVALRWDRRQNPSISKYQIWTTDSQNWQDIPYSRSYTHSHIVSGLANGTEYGFRIRVKYHRQNRLGTQSDLVKATPLATLPMPNRRPRLDETYINFRLTLAGIMIPGTANAPAVVRASDPDGDKLAYRLFGPHALAFSINEAGRLMLTGTLPAPTSFVGVNVSDNRGGDDNIVVSVSAPRH